MVAETERDRSPEKSEMPQLIL